MVCSLFFCFQLWWHSAFLAGFASFFYVIFFFIYAFNPIQFEPHLYGWNRCLKSLCNLFASLQLNLKRTQSILNRFIFRVRLLIFHLNENALNFSCAASCIQPNQIAVVLNAVVDPIFSYHPLMYSVQCTMSSTATLEHISPIRDVR